jgi:putative ABC transport system permease protein
MTATPITLTGLAAAATLLVLDGALSLALGLGVHRQMAIASIRLVVQLVLIGYVLRIVFALGSPGLTLALIVLMALIAARETGARGTKRLSPLAHYAIPAGVISAVTAATLALGLLTALRPHPIWEPRIVIPLAGIILGNVLNAGSLALEGVLSGAVEARAAIEAQLCLGAGFLAALRPVLRRALGRAMTPILNQMSAAGIITLPGIMTGQILAGMAPLAAVRYQILLMFLLSGASFLAALGIAYLAAWRLTDARGRLRLDRLRG